MRTYAFLRMPLRSAKVAPLHGDTMALYSFNRKIQNRSDKKTGKVCNAVFAAAYYRAEKRTCHKIETTIDYTKKRSEVIYADCILPSDATEWATKLRSAMVQDDSGQYVYDATGFTFSDYAWNLIENMEKRYDSQLYIRDIIALPNELEQEEAIALVHDFVKNEIAVNGVFCEVAIHWDLHNKHFHLMRPAFRVLTEEGFSKKVRPTQAELKALLLNDRERWADYANRKLLEYGYDVRIDHRSYIDRGLDLESTIHVGKATHMNNTEHQDLRVAENQRIRAENYQKIQDNPEILATKLAQECQVITEQNVKNELTRYVVNEQVFATIQEAENASNEKITREIIKVLKSQRSIFNERDLKAEVLNFVENDQQFKAVVQAVMQNEAFINLGLGRDGRVNYVSKEAFRLEAELINTAETLAKRNHFKVSQALVNRVAKKHGLNNSQKLALKHLATSADLGLIRGIAGSGKTYMLKAAKEVWEASGYKVRGLAFTGRAAAGLESDANMRSYTIESFMRSLASGRLKLGQKDILVMDESGMTSLDDMHRVFKVAADHGAKMSVVGDPVQTESIGRGSANRALLENFAHVVMEENIRQKVAWQNEATILMEGADPEKGFDAYLKQDRIHFSETTDQAKEDLIDRWYEQYQRDKNKDLKERILIAFKNETIAALNTMARNKLVNEGTLQAGKEVTTTSGVLKLAVGDRIIFNKTDYKLKVKNGHFATIISIKGNKLEVKLDDDRSVSFSLRKYQDINYGYAATVHKVQGFTGNYAFQYIDGHGWDRHLFTVGATRHRLDLMMVADHEHFTDHAALKETVCRYAPKDHVFEYPLSFAMRRDLDEASVSQRAVAFLRKTAEKANDAWLYLANYQEYVERHARVKTVEIAQEELRIRKEAVVVANFADERIAISQNMEKMLALPGYALNVSYRTKPEDIQVKEKTLHLYTEDNLIFYAAKDEKGTIKHMRLEQSQSINEKTLRRIKNVLLDENEYLQISKAEKETIFDSTKAQGYAPIDEESKLHYLKTVYNQQLDNSNLASNIQKQYVKFKMAMAKNRISQEAVEKSVAFGARHDEIQSIAESYVLNQWYDPIAADNIYSDLSSYYSHIVSSFDDENKTAFMLDLKHQAHQRRYETAIERFEENTHLQIDIVKHYLDLDYEVSQGQAELANSSKTDSPTNKYTKEQLEDISLKRDELADQITKDLPSFEFIIEHFAANPRRIHHHRDQFRAKEKIKAFSEFMEKTKGQTLLCKEHLANQIKSKSTMYHSHVKRYFKEGWKQINIESWRFEQRKAISKKSASFKESHQRIRRYFDLAYTASVAWKSAIKRRAKHSPHTEKQVRCAQTISYRRDQLASELMRDIDKHAGALGFGRVDLAKLSSRARSYDYFEKYLREESVIKKLHMANFINENMKAFGHAVGTHRLYKEIKESAHHYRYLQLVKSSPDKKVKEIIRLVEQYNQKRTEAGRAWRQYKNLEDKAKPKEYLLHSAKHLTYQRNKVAYTLMNACAKEALIEPQIKGVKFDCQALEKSSRQHIAYQRVIDYLNTDQKVRGKLAHELLNDKTAYHFVFENQIDFKVLRKEADAWKNEQNIKLETTKHIERKRWDFELISQTLMSNPEETYTAIFGDPKKRSGKEWRFGEGLVVTVKGSHAGKWYSFTAGQGGGPIKAIEFQMGLSFKDALKYGAALAGLSEAQALTTETIDITQNKVQKAKTLRLEREAQERSHSIEAATSIWNGTLPASNTLAERYFVEHRKVTDIQPLDIRYWPQGAKWIDYNEQGKLINRVNKIPAAVIPVRDTKGQVLGVQRIYLDKDTAGKATFMDNAKLSKGITKGLAGVIHKGEPGGRVYIAEGPETAASIALVDKKATVLVSLSVNNLANMGDILRVHSPKDVILAADNDGFGSNSHEATKAAFNQLKQQLSDTDIHFTLVYPNSVTGMDKIDWNDVLVQNGPASLATQLKEARGHLDNKNLYYHQAQSIAYTPAEHYLREIKGLVGVDLSMARYHSSVPTADPKIMQHAIILPAMNQHNEVAAECILYLDSLGDTITGRMINGSVAGSVVVMKHCSDAISSYVTNDFVDAASIAVANKKTNIYVSLDQYRDLEQLTWLFGNKAKTIYLTTNTFAKETEKALYSLSQPLREQGYSLQMAKGRPVGDYSEISINDALMRASKVRGDSFIQKREIKEQQDKKRSLRERLSRKESQNKEIKATEKLAPEIKPIQSGSYYITLSKDQKNKLQEYFTSVNEFNRQDSFSSALVVAEKAHAVYDIMDKEIETLRFHSQSIKETSETISINRIEERVDQSKPLRLHDVDALLNEVAHPKIDTETYNAFSQLTEKMKEHNYDKEYKIKAQQFIEDKSALMDIWKQSDAMPGDGVGFMLDKFESVERENIDRQTWLGVNKSLIETQRTQSQAQELKKDLSLSKDDDRSQGGRSY
jgi:ATP-dependent exoDNAse (exonuclease V) alpha subunit